MFTVLEAVTKENNSQYIESVCLSTDTKPTSGVANGSVCIEMNTGKVFMYNEAGSAWVELQ